MKKNKGKALNQVQIKATADIFLEIAKAIYLGLTLSLLFPKVAGKIELTSVVLGSIVGTVIYLIGIIILKYSKDI